LISIAHGDLRRARYPLAVGHYDGDTIVHAEKRLDDQLDGRLTELFNMYLYPGPEGTVEVIHVPASRPPGALIIGLGNVGEINPSVVRNGVSNAALRHAIVSLNEMRNRDGEAAHELVQTGFSTLLLGTYGGNALSIEASLSAIVQGVIQANEALRSQGLWDKVRINEMQIVELYEDVALEAARAAAYLAEHPPSNLIEGDALQVEPPYMSSIGNGRSQRPIDPYSRGWWRRIQVSSENEDNEGLRFLALTDRARAEDTLQYTQRKFIETAVKKAVNSPLYAEELSTMLFELLIPNSIKDQTRAESDLVLVLDAGTAQYPWELLAERTRKGVEPLAVRMGIIRQFQTKSFTLNPQPARERNALVIGVPKSSQIDLPGARQEALHVAEVLGAAGYDVGGGALNDADSLKVIGQLFAKNYKIIHIAGHGQYVPGKPDESGVILDKDMFLTSKELRNLNPIPELVFINCCHLGVIDGKEQPITESPHALAASISEELIKMGVKAVVAAGWAVNDTAAAAFAKTFYQEMLRGEKFGIAVKSARIAALAAAADSNTWGAYQCYGNPDFVLEREGDSSESARPRDNRCFSRREYLEKLADFKSNAARADAKGCAELRPLLEQLDHDLPSIWRDGAVLRAFGDAWAALGYFDKAIKSYREAAEDEKAEASLNTLEQLANMLGRYADELRLQQRSEEELGEDAPRPNAFLDEAFQRLKWLLELGETAERLSLMGGYYKRMASATQETSERIEHLRSAGEYYGKAHELHKKRRGVVYPYPALNWLTYRFLLGEPLNDEDSNLIEECKAVAQTEDRKEASFWNRVTESDAELLLHLTKGDLEENLERITDLYRRAIQTGATQRELSSVIQHFDFLREMLSSVGKKSAATKKNLDALEKLRATLNSVR
jgi:CHAT domain-containing protein